MVYRGRRCGGLGGDDLYGGGVNEGEGGGLGHPAGGGGRRGSMWEGRGGGTRVKRPPTRRSSVGPKTHLQEGNTSQLLGKYAEFHFLLS